ncbi:hypothetical protein PAPYR_12450 [Paratrimastix pyriformis]|uniref:Uncharacterized protein n=1 Tax=Paratrimastix pyriformis TaxID=342808 RepID=A0ABQ8U6E6_9EUKA|nr:hypothetical protein PAPYR_12450 [Paratrimastix pyriformis]
MIYDHASALDGDRIARADHLAAWDHPNRTAPVIRLINKLGTSAQLLMNSFNTTPLRLESATFSIAEDHRTVLVPFGRAPRILGASVPCGPQEELKFLAQWRHEHVISRAAVQALSQGPGPFRRIPRSSALKAFESRLVPEGNKIVVIDDEDDGRPPSIFRAWDGEGDILLLSGDGHQISRRRGRVDFTLTPITPIQPDNPAAGFFLSKSIVSRVSVLSYEGSEAESETRLPLLRQELARLHNSGRRVVFCSDYKMVTLIYRLSIRSAQPCLWCLARFKSQGSSPARRDVPGPPRTLDTLNAMLDIPPGDVIPDALHACLRTFDRLESLALVALTEFKLVSRYQARFAPYISEKDRLEVLQRIDFTKIVGSDAETLRRSYGVPFDTTLNTHPCDPNVFEQGRISRPEATAGVSTAQAKDRPSEGRLGRAPANRVEEANEPEET